jgi:bifunctional non-homologous end joining protein LigD
MAGLDEYRRKRDASRTPEPVPAEGPLPTGNNDTFVIQEHHATALHWDVRLERDGVLVSFAVPRGLPDVPGDIRLAVHTEDHPMEYLNFSGEIPKGEYGGGRMFIWDRGRYETVKWSDREVAVVFNGTKAQGKYTFFRSGKSDRDWMVRRSDPPLKRDFSPLPELVEPMLASPGTLPDDEDDWSYEFKWDGVRALAKIEGGRLRLHSRKGNDITVTYPELRLLGEELGSTQAWLDGEIVAMKDGRPSFPALQQRMHVHNDRQARSLSNSVPVTYLVFDVLHLDGKSTVDLPYVERRALLESLELNGRHWHTSPTFDGDGAAVVETAREQQLEGVIAKRRSSRYFPGRRSADWLKITEVLTIEVLIGGWRPGEGRREGSIGSLMIGVPTDAGLRYVGQVGTGFTDEVLAGLHDRLKPLVQKASPFANEVPRERAKGATWVRPELVGEVEFRNWTPDGRLRAPSWRGLRSDKDAADLEPEAAPDLEPDADVTEEDDEPRPTNVLVEVDGRRLRLTNLDKVLYPDAGFTKAQVIDYYSRIAPFLLPHLKDRPVTLRRFPDGVTGQPFYEKNAARNAPEWVRTVTIETPGSASGNETLDFVLGTHGRAGTPRATVEGRPQGRTAGPRPAGLRPRPGRPGEHRRVLRGGAPPEGRPGGTRPEGVREDQRQQGHAAVRPDQDDGRGTHVGVREGGGGTPGPREPEAGRGPHGQGPAPRQDLHRLEPEQPVQDDDRPVLHARPPDPDGLDPGHVGRGREVPPPQRHDLHRGRRPRPRGRPR